jgi:hypothetical protein
MKRYILILSSIILLLPSCRKVNDIPTSGTATINNDSHLDQVLQTYTYDGFLFSAGKQVSILDTPPPDITLINDGTLYNFIFEADNLENSFYKVGKYSNASSAKNVFDTLTVPVVMQWAAWADSLKPNQIWLYKSGNEHYAKMRIISTFSERRKPVTGDSTNYSECTFEWVYQPDGSLTFPGK